MIKDITKHIINFRDFLNACWPFLDELMLNHDWDSDGDFIDDWLQMNWELLVERELLEGQGFLTQFSVTHLSDRIIRPEAVANYTVIAKSERIVTDLKRKIIVPFDKGLRLYSFSTFKNRGYGLYPPFDLAELVLDSKKELFIVPIKDLNFYLKSIKPEKKNDEYSDGVRASSLKIFDRICGNIRKYPAYIRCFMSGRKK